MNRIYIRCSTLEQEYSRQVYIIEKAGYVIADCVIYEEKESGKSTKKRHELKRLLNDLQSGDSVIITDLSRLARSVRDLWEISDEIVSKKATLVSVKENIDLASPSGRLVFSMLSAISQFERDVLSERTKDGLAAKRKSGVRLGRPNVIDENIIELSVIEYLKGQKTYKQVGKEFGISDVTVFNAVKRYKEGQN